MPLQPNLISTEQGITQAVVELFPDIWQVAEKISSPDVKARRKALKDLKKTQAARVSPLIAYLLATRILDPDIEFRAQVIEYVASLMVPDPDGRHAEDEVRSQIFSTMSSLDVSGLMALVEAAVWDDNLVPQVSTLVNYVPSAGQMLGEFVADRSLPISNRAMAILLIGQVGYVDAVSELERIQNRIQSRQSGQSSMPFAPAQNKREFDLLPALKQTITILRTIR